MLSSKQHLPQTCMRHATVIATSQVFLYLVPISDHLINKTRFHHQGLPNVGVCKVVARSLLVKQSGFLAPLPPLTAPTLFVALLTGSSLAAECEKLGCAIIIGGADQESNRAANLRSRCGRKRLRRDNCRRFFTARTSTRSTGLEEIGNSLE